MEDENNNIKKKIRVVHILYVGGFVMFCLVVTLVIQIMIVAGQVSQAEIKAESVWDKYPQLVQVYTVFSECRNGGKDYEDGYFTKEQCQSEAMEKARQEDLEEKAKTAFHEYKARVDVLIKNIDEPWPLSAVSRPISSMASNLDT